MVPPASDSAPVDAALEHGRLTSLVNSMADGVIAVDEMGLIVLYNGAALNILDLNSSMHGKAIDSVIKLVDKNNQLVDVKKLVLSTKTPSSSRDLRLKYSDNDFMNLYLSIAPVHLGFGHEKKDEGFVMLLRDITREKSLEEERDEFISVVSHELRTPIAIAEGNIGNAQVLTEKLLDNKQIKDALEQAHQQILFLGGLINDLSTLSRAERGKLTVEIEDINAHELVNELIKNYTPESEKKGLVLKTAVDPQLELLKSCRLYVREILQNFITNAIKYTEKGYVLIGAKPTDKGVTFFVEDTGIGISKSDQEKVFDKFFRSEDFRTRQNNGTGLGLYVTAKLARLIHAEITLNSELNKGSIFTIFVPNLQ